MRKTILGFGLVITCLAFLSGCGETYKRSVWNPQTGQYETRGGD